MMRCVLVGSSGVGKTSLIIAQVEGTGHPGYLPSVYGVITGSESIARVAVDDAMLSGRRNVNLALWDTAGEDDYQLRYLTSVCSIADRNRFRPMCYNHAEVFMLCFSLVCPTSYRDVYTKWYPDVAKYAPHTPIVLVGLKHDLRADEMTTRRLREENGEAPIMREDGEAPITREEGERLRNDIGASGYVECSSQELFGLSHVFQETAKAAVGFGGAHSNSHWDRGNCSKEKSFIF